MHEMQTVVTDVRGVSVRPLICLLLGFTVQGSFGAAFAKALWPLVFLPIR